MPDQASLRKEAVFDNLVPQLEADGFSVFLHPSKDMLPAALVNSRPDAIASKRGTKLAIEVLSEANTDGDRVERIRQAVSELPGWEFRLIYAPPREDMPDLPPLSKAFIETYLDQIEGSLERMGPSAALLTAWAAFEAASRQVAPSEFGRPQNAARLIERLAFGGYITPDEADLMRRIYPLRDAIAHGRLELVVTGSEVRDVVGVTRSMLAMDD